jgi:hypothetical protein
VGIADGVRGAAINPAALADVKNLEMAFAMTGGRDWRARNHLSLGAGDMVGDISVPFEFLFRRTDGLQQLSFGARTPLCNVGFMLLETEHIGIQLSGMQRVIQNLDVKVPYTLTSNDIPGLPAGVEIPVVFHISGEAQIDLDGAIDSRLDQKPTMVAAAKKLGVFGLGVGLKLSTISGYLDSKMEIDGEGTMSGTAPADSGDWTVDLTGAASIKRQTLLGYEGAGQVKGRAIGLIAGTQIKGRHGGIGVVVELATPVSLTSDYISSSCIAFGTPEIEGLSGNVQVDTAGRAVRGNVNVGLSPIPMRDGEGVKDGVVYSMPAEARIRIGAAANFPGFTLAVDAGKSLSLERHSSNLYFLLVGLGLRPLRAVSLHSIVELSTRTVQFAEMSMTIPSGTLVAGASLQLTPFLELDTALSANTLTYIGSSWEEMAGKFDPNRVLETALASAGIRVSF